MVVSTVAVHDTVSRDGQPLEDTLDWYAQDRDGNVWYFGEDTKQFDCAHVDTTGSFEAGVNGALPGIVMPGHPHIGDKYRQEFAKGLAEDIGEVLSVSGTEKTPLTGPAVDLLVTKDADLLEPTGPAENKYYARCGARSHRADEWSSRARRGREHPEVLGRQDAHSCSTGQGSGESAVKWVALVNPVLDGRR